MLSNRLEQLIGSLGIRKGDFAEKIGFSQAYVSMILNGKRPRPSDRFFDSVNRAFGVNTDWLRHGEGNMFSLPEANLSTADMDLLQKYHSLPLSERKIVDEIVDAMLSRHTAKSGDS